MVEIYGRVCTEGHIIKTRKSTSITNYYISDSKNNRRIISRDKILIEGDAYCQTCGSETIEICPSCKKDLIRMRIDELSKPHTPSYCRNCGGAYPWVGTIEEKKVREGPFIEIGVENVGGQFYPNLIKQINNCYEIKANEATQVLYRKLIENLIVDILRGHYGMEEVELFFDTEKGSSQMFSNLLNNFKSSEGDLLSYSDAMGENLYRLIEEFKHKGDASAHTIERDISDEEIEKQSDEATKLAKILFEMRKNIYVAN